MADRNILDEIEAKTRELVGEKLRSKAIVITRLYPLIEQANQLGHAHKAIHARILAAGLETTERNYQTYLYRARARAEKGGSHEPKQAKRGSYEPRDEVHKGDPSATAVTPPPTSPPASATAVLDALRESSEVGRKDYSSIVREKMRQGSKRT